MAASLDLIVFGATGFTGRLVAEYLNTTYGLGGKVKWAIAGRNLDKLARVRDEIGAGDKLPLLAADASDAKALAGLVSQAKAIITTVGPYQRHGEPLVTACAQAGTDYVVAGDDGHSRQRCALLGTDHVDDALLPALRGHEPPGFRGAAQIERDRALVQAEQ